MFSTKMKLAVLACGLIATGTVVVAQQEARKPEAEVRSSTAKARIGKGPTTISDTQIIKSPIETDREREAVETDLDGQLAEIEANLLQEEVEALGFELNQSRERVGVAFTNRFHSAAKALESEQPSRQGGRRPERVRGSPGLLRGQSPPNDDRPSPARRTGPDARYALEPRKAGLKSPSDARRGEQKSGWCPEPSGISDRLNQHGRGHQA